MTDNKLAYLIVNMHIEFVPSFLNRRVSDPSCIDYRCTNWNIRPRSPIQSSHSRYAIENSIYWFSIRLLTWIALISKYFTFHQWNEWNRQTTVKCLNLSVIVLLQYPQEGAVHTMLKASLTNYLYDGEGWGDFLKVRDATTWICKWELGDYERSF